VSRIPGARLCRTTIRHARTAPVRHAFAHHSYSWLVDLDRLPRLGLLGPLARFESRDHLGDPARPLRHNVDALLRRHGIELHGGRVLMLTSARVLGYVFNPITVYWCHARDGDLACAVVEVHNTYGDRHAYVVRPDEHGHANAEKALYVSPFNDVEGSYELALPVPTDRVHLGVVLHRAGQPPFAASLVGDCRPATTGRLLRLALRRPLEPLAVTARIRWHGIRLWLRGLPVRPRPAHHQEALR
jgi:DUF1365 family protein